MFTRIFVTTAVLLLLASPGWSQTIPITLNPSSITFTPSPDHSALKLDGTPVLTRYDVTWVEQNALGAIAFTKVLANPKPTPNAQGQIVLTTAELPELLTLKKDVPFKAIVIAIGPDGANPSDPSNLFGIPGPARAPGKPGAPVAK